MVAFFLVSNKSLFLTARAQLQNNILVIFEKPV